MASEPERRRKDSTPSTSSAETPAPSNQAEEELVDLKYEDISEVLSDLNLIENTVRLFRNELLIIEFLYNAGWDENILYFVGSTAEGTWIDSSDIDSLIISKGVIICQNYQEVRETNGKGLVFLMDRTDCQPGYTKLKLMISVEDEKAFKNHSILKSIENTDSGKYLSSRKAVEFDMITVGTSYNVMNRATYIRKDGPCACIGFEPQHNLLHNHVERREVEMAFGLELYSITKEGENWLKTMDATQMERCWPSVETIERIKALKIEVVAVGEDALKWRISYSLWERDLIWSFHDVQYICYRILKHLLKKKLKKISKDVTSYHLKNVVFWESFESDTTAKMLQNSSLLFLLIKCLNRLKKSIDEKKLDHFIDRERNLFLTKLKEAEERDKLKRRIDELISNLVPMLLSCIGRNNLKDRWWESGSEPVEFLNSLKTAGDEGILFCSSKQFKNCVKRLSFGDAIHDIKRILFKDNDKTSMDLNINRFDAMEKLDIEKTFIETTKRIIDFRTWLIGAGECLPENLDFSICHQWFTDSLSDRLYLCGLLINVGKYQEAEAVIDDFFEAGPKLLLCCGDHFPYYYGVNVQDAKATFELIRNSSLNVPEDDPFPFVHNVFVYEKDIKIFPSAIQIQSNLEDHFSINSIFYMYYLKVVCDFDLNRNAEDSFRSLEGTADQLARITGKFDFRCYNLLGHACLLTGRYHDAYNCFLSSIEITVSTRQRNSAFYLLSVLIYCCLEFHRVNCC